MLRVTGRERACPPKVFELLVLLCRAQGKLLSRGELLDALWPGGQVISDEALSQAIFRARTTIEPYGRHILTVRGKGVRLDTGVTVLADPDPSLQARSAEPVETPASAGSSSPATPLPSSAPRPHRRPWLAGAALAIALVATFLWFRAPGGATAPAPQVINSGYGLLETDLHAGSPDTAALVTEALKNESSGDRARAIVLLEAVHKQDSSTPIPALLLALWSSGQGHLEQAHEWLGLANQRIGETSDLYLNLFRDYITAEISGDPKTVINVAGALLDVRPGAWRMHHARAHLLDLIGMRDAAMEAISMIQVDRFGDRKLEQSVADRASLGDVAGAQEILDRLGPSTSPAAHAFLSGRVAWSRGDIAAANRHFEAAVTPAYESGRLDIHRRALIFAGATDALLGHNGEAIAHLEQARGLVENHSTIDTVDVTLLLAELHAETGQLGSMDAELDRALAAPPQFISDYMQVARAMITWRLRPGRAIARPEGLSPEFDALWRAMAHYAGGEEVAAAAALDEARVLGIGKTRAMDDARWLELQLGEAVSPEQAMDPPYPPTSRVVVRRQIREALAAQEALAAGE